MQRRHQAIEEAVARHAGTEGAALPMLHDIQAALGFIPEEAVPRIAAALNRSRAEVHGVVTFYHDFRAAPAGRHLLRLCQAEACQAMGARELAAKLSQRLGVAMGETAADGRLTLEPVYCLGLCACAPAGMLDGEPLGRMDAACVEMIGEAVGA